MNPRNNFSGQRVDSRDHNDNAPFRYSAPRANFKAILAYYADQSCRHCSGTGYLGRFKHVCAGRCFECINENVFEQAQEKFDQTCEARTGCDEMAEIYRAVCGNDGGGPAYLSDGMWVTLDGKAYDSAEHVVLGSQGLSSALRSACSIA